MIRSYPWSRYDVARERPRPRRQLLLLIPLAALLLYGCLLFATIDWSQAQTMPLLDLAGQRLAFYWAPDPPTTALWHAGSIQDQLTNLVQIRWR
jgi:hypothetical protein